MSPRSIKHYVRQGMAHWFLGRAVSYNIVSQHYRDNKEDYRLWRSLMRRNALQAIQEAKCGTRLSR
jgi:hypothetical protein